MALSTGQTQQKLRISPLKATVNRLCQCAEWFFKKPDRTARRLPAELQEAPHWLLDDIGAAPGYLYDNRRANRRRLRKQQRDAAKSPSDK